MEDKQFYDLSSSLEVLKISVVKDISIIESSLENLKNFLEKDITHIIDMNEQLKNEIWELKANAKTIHQNEVDIATLIERASSNTELLKSYKSELEAKMVTKDYLNEKRYKDWRLWLGIAGILFALGFSVFNTYHILKKDGEKNVLSSHQK